MNLPSRSSVDIFAVGNVAITPTCPSIFIRHPQSILNRRDTKCQGKAVQDEVSYICNSNSDDTVKDILYK